jgi:GT2 family glycosyltransferase
MSRAPAGILGLRPPIEVAVPGVRRVAAVLVTWNRRGPVSLVLEAISKQRYPLHFLDVIVVDNASADGTLEALEARWRPERVVDNPTQRAHEPAFSERSTPPGRTPNAAGVASLTLIRNRHNLGGCGGFNTGFAWIEHAMERAGEAPDFAWLIDDDVDLPEDALAQLVRTAQAEGRIGLVGSRSVNFERRDETIETTIYFDSRLGRMADEPPPGHRLRDAHLAWVRTTGGTRGVRAFSGVREVDIVSACSLLARWSAVRQVGYWDYRYFIYCDDADWCLRMARAGYRVVCDLDAVVYHTPWHHKLTPARLYYSQRNVVWTLQKMLPPARARWVTLRWMGHLLRTSLLAALRRRLFHAEIIRRTADDIARGRWGRFEDRSPPLMPLLPALEAASALSPRATVLAVCPTQDALERAERLRAHVAHALARQGRSSDQPRWRYMVRNSVRDPSPRHASALEPARLPPRWVYSSRLRSRLYRQLPLLLRPPRAVVVFDQTCDVPVLRGGWNVHVERGEPGRARLERDGPVPRLLLLARWGPTLVRVSWHVLTLCRSPRAGRFG